MIEVRTNLRVTQDESLKSVVVEMHADDAFALATILMNMDPGNISDDWKKSFRMLATELTNAGNRCRR